MDNITKALKFFADNKDRQLTINGAAKELGMNYRIAYEAIRALEKEGLVDVQRHGNCKLCRLSYNYNDRIVKVEEARISEVTKNRDLKLIIKRIQEIQNPFYILALFGSHASKKNKTHSDVDLCVISDNSEIMRQVADILSVIPIDIDLQEFTTEEFMSMIKKKGNNVGNEIIKNNIILHGIENFYNLVDHARHKEST